MEQGQQAVLLPLGLHTSSKACSLRRILHIRPDTEALVSP